MSGTDRKCTVVPALLLPQQICLVKDRENELDGPIDYEFVLGAYKQVPYVPT